MVGTAGVLGVSGCQEDDPGTRERTPTRTTSETTTAATATAELTSASPPSVDVTVAAVERNSSRVLTVDGSVRAAAGVDEVVIAAGGDEVRIAGNGTVERTVAAELPVDGGRSYDVEVTVVGADGARTVETFETGHVPAVETMDADRLVGVHYYPWYEMHGGHRNWTDRTPSEPTLGEYASDDPAVVEQHLQWCLEHGIQWLSVSWWGPNSGSDAALNGTVVEADGFEDVEFSILYETVGRLEEFSYDLDRPAARDRLRNDLRYLAETYFGRENYRRVDGRPVVFFYVANSLTGDVEAAFDEATRELDVEPYVLADIPFGTPPDAHAVIQVADAVTTYNPYAARPDIADVFHDVYEHGNKVMHLGAEAADVDYVPAVIPGYDDTEIPDSQREDNPVLPASPERYERVCEQVAPHLPDAESVLVTSFNEWYENTQIEPTETYGTAYLELTADKLASGSAPAFDPDGSTLRFDFNRTVVPAEVNPESTDTRRLAFMMGGLHLLDGDDEVRSFDVGTPSSEPLFVEGAFSAESDDSRSWRWLGGYGAETTLFVEGDTSDADRAVLVGQPMRSDTIEATVYVDGTRTDDVAFGDRTGEFAEYEVSLTPDDG